jgi:hypothetical protein
MSKKLLLTTFLLSFIASLFAQNPLWPNYCLPTAQNIANGVNIGIQNVTINTPSANTINNTTPATGGGPTYLDYTNLSYNVAPGGTVNFSVLNGSANSTQVKIYIDYNRDGVYNTFAPELAWTTTNTAPNQVVSDNFIVPSGTTPGAYRVRFVGDFAGATLNNPCQVSYGDVEDYTMIVKAPTEDAQSIVLVSPTKFVLGNNTVSFRVANLSPVTMTSLNIGYQFNNGTPVTQTLSSLNIPSGGVFVATFSTPLNLGSAGTFPFKVWTGDVNTVTPPTPNDDTLSVTAVVCNALAGTYTIDPAGSGTTNFTTIGAAVQSLMNCGVSAPVTFNIASGTYNEQVDFGTVDGATPANSITFQSATGNPADVIVTFNATSTAGNYILD